MNDHKKDFWWWFEEKDQTFTVDQVRNLCERIKEFNAGAIDEYLSNHVDSVINEWLVDNKVE